jgi:peptide/nickel transport system permease protein
MAKLLLRRLRDLIVILFVVSTMMFFIVRLIPGNPAQAMLGPNATPQQVSQLSSALGLSGPLWLQYLHWLSAAVRGNLGTSIAYGVPVVQLVAERVLPTLTLAVLSTIISFALCVVIVTWNALAPGNPVARVVHRLSSLGVAMPDFWIGLMLVLLFSTTLRWLPPVGYDNLFTSPGLAIPRLVLPVAVLVIGQTALFTMVLSASTLDELGAPYLRTARMKGLSEVRIAVTHVLPNALLPLLTVLGTNFALLVGGVVVVENIFVIPGLGTVAENAILTRDFPVIQGVTLFLALLFVVVNTIVDLCYGLLDPKVRVS